MKTPISFWNVFAYLIAGIVAGGFLIGTATYLIAGQGQAAVGGIGGGLAGALVAGVVGITRRFR